MNFEEARALCCRDGISVEEVRSSCQLAYAGMSEAERRSLLIELAKWGLWLKNTAAAGLSGSADFAELLSRCRAAEFVFANAFPDWRDPKLVRIPRTQEDKVGLAAYAALYEKQTGHPLSKEALAYFARLNSVKFLSLPVERFEERFASLN